MVFYVIFSNGFSVLVHIQYSAQVIQSLLLILFVQDTGHSYSNKFKQSMKIAWYGYMKGIMVSFVYMDQTIGTYVMPYANNKGTDHSAYPDGLIRAFAVY